jgi:hypothetical protein
MQLQEIPRTAVRTYLRAARLPVTAAATFLRRDGQDDWPPALAFESFEAGVKQVMGSVLRDEELVHEGRLAQAKVGQLRKAVELESVADQHKADADEEFNERLQADEERRAQVERQAAESEAALDRQRAEEKRRADDKARRQAEAARKAEAASQKAVAKQERAARATRVSAEREALTEERQAATAKRKVTQLDKDLEATKATRKGAK